MASAVPVTQAQAYLRCSAQRRFQKIPVPPFTFFLCPGVVASEDDHAVPDEPLGGDVRGPLAELRDVCDTHSRRPRVRFLAEFAPSLALALRVAGMVEERSVELLGCTPGTLIQPPEVPGLTMVTLDAGSALSDIREGLDTNERGFDPGAQPVTDAQAREFREGLVDSRAFVARVDGEPAAAGMFHPPHDGVTELAGIATIEEFRRRGVASSLTAFAVDVAFKRGAELVFLTTEDAVARRVYERVGFRPYAALISYAEPLPTR